MTDLVRFGVSIERSIIEPFDNLIAREEYGSRSEALRDLIRERLIHEHEKNDGLMFGTLTLVYEHHQRGIDARLTDIQHEHAEAVISTVHVHIDHDYCLQVLVLRGEGRVLRALAGRIKALRGVHHAVLSLTAPTQ